MHFTREPIIETVIVSKEGHKLLIRNSKRSAEEEYTIDAVEVISFGNSLFFRSKEKPKAFLLPISDYEVIEIKEARLNIKNVAADRSIKIASSKDKDPQEKSEENSSDTKDRKKRKGRRTKRSNDQQEKHTSREEKKEVQDQASSDKQEETPPLSKLFPPPPTLIQEKLTKYKEAEIVDANLSEKADLQDPELPKEKPAAEEKKPKETRKEGFDFPEPEPLDEPIFHPDFLDLSPEETIAQSSEQEE